MIQSLKAHLKYIKYFLGWKFIYLKKIGSRTRFLIPSMCETKIETILTPF